MKINIPLWVFGVLFLAAVAGGARAAEEPIIIKFSHVVERDTPKGKAAERFRELAEKSTGGRVRVEIYPNSILYKDREELEALQLGAVQMLAPSLAKFGPLGIKEFEVFDLPFLFSSIQGVHRVTQGPIGKDLLSKLEAKGLTGLAYWDNGFKLMSANRPLRQPADFKGLKMRIQSSKVLDAQMRALGANPQMMGFSEVYEALQDGTVDGAENSASNLYTQKMHEVQKHLTISDHGYLGYVVIVNQKFWSQLPSDVRRKLEAAMREATKYANAIAEQENVRALAAVKDSGKTRIHILTAEEKAEWRQALLPVWKEMEERIGAELIEAVQWEAGKVAPR
ncbi:MAG: TRAP transporter substrate-binding protein [Noviherbaspirillum sp.]